MGKFVVVILIFIIVFFSVMIFYRSMPSEPVEMKAGEIIPEYIELINYGAVPVFAENLRFNHNVISYFIEDECLGVRRNAMVEAFALFAEEMGIISFYEVSGDADINVGCSNDYIPLGENLFAAGEGGPSRIINTSNFKTIEKGKISLYDDPRCDYPVVEVHELCHVFGFDHSLDPKNIMFNVSNCDQRFSNDMIKLIDDLYSIEPLADALIKDVTSVITGKYLDFNITIFNEGMIGIDDINLAIVVDDVVVQIMEIGEIGIGYGRTLKATNVELPSRNVEVIDFVVDKYDDVRELDEGNNEVTMVVKADNI